eukprot:COSAG02_NODE_57_length_43668_cov_118.217196_44_plen_102_part_00
MSQRTQSGNISFCIACSYTTFTLLPCTFVQSITTLYIHTDLRPTFALLLAGFLSGALANLHTRRDTITQHLNAVSDLLFALAWKPQHCLIFLLCAQNFDTI